MSSILLGGAQKYIQKAVSFLSLFADFNLLSCQGCSGKFYQPGNHKLQTGSWLKVIPGREVARAFRGSATSDNYWLKMHFWHFRDQVMWCKLNRFCSTFDTCNVKLLGLISLLGKVFIKPQ